MKQVVTHHFCDVCQRREVFSGEKPNDWEFISYGKTWRSGSHAGIHELNFLACEACLKEDSPKLFSKLLAAFKSR
jgi:hypothetical protein